MTSALTSRSLARTARKFQRVPLGSVPSRRGMASAVAELVVMMPSRILSRPNSVLETSIVEAKFPANRFTYATARFAALDAPGSVPISLQMMVSMISSEPPPIEPRRESR